MRVAVDVTPMVPPRTGIGHFTAELLAALRGHERDVDVLPFAVSARAPRHHMPSGTRFVPAPASLAHMWWGRSSWPPADRVLGRPDVVHATNFVAPPTRAPAVVSVHDLTFVHHPEWCRPEVLAMVPIVRRAIARGAWVHTLTDTVGAAVRDAFATDRVRTVYPAGASPVSFESTAVVPRAPFALVLGGRERRKNVDAVTDLFARDAPAGLTLVVTGVPPVGHVSDAERTALLYHASVLLHPALDEGFGLPVVEAMAAGVPVVCTDTAVLREVAGDAALFVDASWRDAADVIAAAATDDDVRARLIAAGRARASRYTWEATAHGIAELYRTALANAT